MKWFWRFAKRKIATLNYYYGDGMSYGMSYHITADSENKCIVVADHFSHQNRYEMDVDSEHIKRLNEFVKGIGVGRWNGFHRSNKHVCDGTSWSLEIKFDNNDEIRCSGYMKFPRNYSKFKEYMANNYLDL